MNADAVDDDIFVGDGSTAITVDTSEIRPDLSNDTTDYGTIGVRYDANPQQSPTLETGESYSWNYAIGNNHGGYDKAKVTVEAEGTANPNGAPIAYVENAIVREQDGNVTVEVRLSKAYAGPIAVHWSAGSYGIDTATNYEDWSAYWNEGYDENVWVDTSHYEDEWQENWQNYPTWIDPVYDENEELISEGYWEDNWVDEGWFEQVWIEDGYWDTQYVDGYYDDYEGTLWFSAGETQKQLTFDIFDDWYGEADESFVISLDQAWWYGGSYSPRSFLSGTVTILDNDRAVDPVTGDDAFTTAEDEMIASGNVRSNDVDFQGATLTYYLMYGTTSGTLTFPGDGTFTYIPNAGFSGTDSFSYYAYNGSVSSEPATVIITIDPVNDAPVLAYAQTAWLNNLNEDDVSSTGTAIDDIVMQLSISDDEADPIGIVIVGVNGAAGVWEYTLDNGGIWSDIGTVAPNSARLLSGAARLRFVPDPDWNSGVDGPAGLIIRAWDGTDGFANGDSVDASAYGGDSAYSEETAMVFLTVDPINDAPWLDDTQSPVLDPIDEDDFVSGGTLVADLIAQAYADDLEGDSIGIALTYVDQTNGSWEFSLDGGSSWTAVGFVHDSSALLLAAAARLRFVPSADWNSDLGGDVVVTFRAWDGSDGNASGATGVNATSNGGISAFSAQTLTAYLSVAAVNDDFDVIGDSRSVGRYGVLQFNAAEFLTSDVEHDAAVTAYSVDHGTLTDDGTGWFYFSPDGYCGSATITLTFSDGEFSHDATIVVDCTNVAPTLAVGHIPFSDNIEEDDFNSSGVTVQSLLDAAGAGDYEADGLGMALIGVDDANGQWQYSLNGGATWSAVGPVSDASALLLDGAARIRFVPNPSFNSDDGGPVSITFRAWDGNDGHASGTTGVNLGDTGGESPYSAEITAASLYVNSVNSDFTVGDDDWWSMGHNDSWTFEYGPYVTNDVEGDAALVGYSGGFGTLINNGDGTLTFTPDGVTGMTDIVLTFGDGVNFHDVRITVESTNVAPTLMNNAGATVDEEGTVTIGSAVLSTTDDDDSPETLIYTIVTAPTNGTLLRYGAPLASGQTFSQAEVDEGAITYRHDGGETVSDAFTFYVADNTASIGPATFEISVNPVNDDPTATEPGTPIIVHDEVRVTEADLLAAVSAADVDSASLAASIEVPAYGNYGTLTWDAAAQQYVYTPNYAGYGDDEFTLTVTDDQGATVDVVITFSITNETPMAASGSLSLDHNTTLQITGAELAALLGVSDPDDDPLTVSYSGGDGYGQLNYDLTNDVYTYQAGTTVGSDVYTFAFTDSYGAAVRVELTIDVTNTAPTVSDAWPTIDEDGSLTIGGSDVDFDSLTVLVTGGPANGTLMDNGDGTVTYTPSENFNGSDDFQYQLFDGNDYSAVATVWVTINPVNDDFGVIPSDSYSLGRNDVWTFSAGAYLTDDVDGDVGVSGSVDVGTLTSDGTGNFTYTPDGYVGPATILLHFSDGTFSHDVYIAITATNAAPTVSSSAVSFSGPSEQRWSVAQLLAAVGAADADGPSDSLTASFAVPAQGSYGALAWDATTQQYVYTPNNTGAGSDVFVLTVADDQGATADVNVTFTVTNSAPTAADASYPIHHDSTEALTKAQLFAILGVSDVDGDALTVTYAGDDSFGTLAYDAETDDYTFTAGAVTGDNPYVFTFTDPAGAAAEATLTFSVINEAPTVADQSVTIDEDTGLWVGGADAEGDPLTAAIVTQPTHGVATVNANGTVTYTPNANYFGADSFQYRVSDGIYDSNVATISVTIAPVSDLPTAVDDHYTIRTAHGVAADVDFANYQPNLANDLDPDQSAALSSTPPAGEIQLSPGGTLSYAYTITDGDSDHATARVYIHVVDNRTPVALNPNVSIAPNTVLQVAPTAAGSDVDNDVLTFVSASTAAHGTVAIVNNQLVYTPATNFLGDDDFTYTLSDGRETVSGTVHVTVIGNLAPTAIDDVVTTTKNTAVAFSEASLKNNDSDPDGDALDVVGIYGHPQHGTIVWHSNGTFTYTPIAGFIGLDSFQYGLSDGEDENRATIWIEVGPLVTDAANNDALTTDEDASLALRVTRDRVGGEPVTHFRLTTDHGTLTLNGAPLTSTTNVTAADAQSGFLFTPTPNYHGAANITIQAGILVDGVFTAIGSLETNSLIVNSVDDPTQITVPAPFTVGDGQERILTGTDRVLVSDIDGNQLSVTISAVNGLVQRSGTPNGVTSFTVSGTAAQINAALDNLRFTSGSASSTAQLTIQATDLGTGAVVTASVGIHVVPRISIYAPAVAESGGQLQVTFFRTSPTSETATFDWNTQGRTAASGAKAEAGIDYVASSGSVTFLPGEVSKSVSIDLLSDSIDEAIELFEIRLTNLVNCWVVTNPWTLFINDDDPTPSLSAANVTVDESEGIATVQVSLSAPSGLPITIEWRPADGTATRPSDWTQGTWIEAHEDGDDWVEGYWQDGGLLIFAPGETEKTIEIAINPDAINEGSESFSIEFSNPQNAVWPGPTPATVTIVDVNHDPVAGDDVYFIDEDAPLSIAAGEASSLADNDSDPDADSLTYSLVDGQGPQQGSLTLAADGSFTYTPAADWFGTDAFTYQVDDGRGGIDTAHVTITVNPVNDAPSFVKGSDVEALMDGGEITIVDWATEVSAGPENEQAGQTLNFTVVADHPELFAPAGQPRLELNANGNYDLIFTPNAGAYGAATLSITLHDDGGTADGGINVSVPQNCMVGISPFGQSGDGGVGSDPSYPLVGFLRTEMDVTEGDNSNKVRLKVVLSRPSDKAIAVDWYAASGTAYADVDFEAAAGRLNFAIGQIESEIDVTLIDDSLDRGDNRQFRVALVGAIGAGLAGGYTIAEVTLNENDATVTVGEAWGIEGVDENGDPNKLIFEMSLSRPLAHSVTIDYSTSGAGTADISDGSGSVTFAPGETSKPVELEIINDDQWTPSPEDPNLRRGEPTKSLKLEVSSNSPFAMPGTPYAMGTIVDDDWQRWEDIGSHIDLREYTNADVDIVDGLIYLDSDPECVERNKSLTSDPAGLTFSPPPGWTGGNFWYINPNYHMWVSKDPVDDPHPAVTLQWIDTEPVTEEAMAKATFRLTAWGTDYYGPLTISYETHSMTAVAGEDFDAVNGSITFTTDGSHDIEVFLRTDELFEPLESFQFIAMAFFSDLLISVMFAEAAIDELGVTLDIFNGQYDEALDRNIPLSGNIKVTRGAFTVANLNDTDGDLILDRDDAIVKKFSAQVVGAQPGLSAIAELSTTDGLRVGDTVFFNDLITNKYEYAKITNINGGTIQVDKAIDLQTLKWVSLPGENEVDLMRLIIRRPTGVQNPTGNMVLTIPNSVRIWKNAWKGDSQGDFYQPNAQGQIEFDVQNIPADGLVIWAEAIQASQSLADISIKLSYMGKEDEVRATALWIGQDPAMLHNNGDVFWQEGLVTPQGQPIANNSATAVNLSGGFGIQNQAPHPAIPNATMLSNVMAQQWSVGPADIGGVSGVYFDVSRRVSRIAWEQNIQGNWTPSNPENFPMHPERPNDDLVNGDETDVINGALYSFDGVGLGRASPAALQRAVMVGNFYEFVRISFRDKPRGNMVVGSRASGYMAWHSVTDVHWDQNVNDWVRFAGVNSGEDSHNNIGPGLLTFTFGANPDESSIW